MAHRLELVSSRISAQESSSSHPQTYIVASKRTPIGIYMGKLSNYKAPELGALSIKAALEQASIKSEEVQEVILGNVLSAGIGQAPARQAAIKAGLKVSTTCTTINKVCSSGLKSIVYGSQSIALKQQDVVVVGGFESMSNAPHLIMNARKGVGHGDKTLIDCLTHDGLTDAFQHISMGLCAQKTAKEMKITRQAQDQFCIDSYEKHLNATKNGYLKDQIVPVKIQSRKKQELLDKDEEVTKYKRQAIPKLKPAFQKNGTVTSANASKINDGACSLVLMSQSKVRSSNVKPLARIVAYADAQIESVDFCRSPYYATIKALKLAGLSPDQIDFYEFNEAFSVVPLAMMEMLKLPKQKVNAFGGAVAMGHPIGMSGARIVQSLLTVMRIKGGKYGLVGICNGGGGSTAMIIENMQ